MAAAAMCGLDVGRVSFCFVASIDTGAFFRAPASDSGRGKSAHVMHQWPLRLREHVPTRSIM
jgi:hypothetical protein